MRRLCAVTDIADPGSRGFDGDALFAVRRGETIAVYRNVCPHAGAPLNWMPDRFLDRDKEHIQCTVHGALFRIRDGACVAGPCPGQHLSPVPFEVRDGDLWVED